MELSAVMFDLDGTLADSLPGIEYSIDTALQQCGCAPRSTSVRTLIGPPVRNILGQLTGAEAPELDRLESAFRVSYDSDGWQKTYLFEGVNTLLHCLHARGVSLFLVTNKPEQCTVPILDSAGIRPLFTDIVCRKSPTRQFASKEEMVRYVVARHAIEPGRCVFIGDTPEDHHAAAGAGITALLMKHGYGFRSGNDSHSCQWLSSFRELQEFLHV